MLNYSIFYYSSLIQIETAGAIDILGSMSAQFIHIISNNTVTVEGSIKSQHSDCITTDVFHGSVRVYNEYYLLVSRILNESYFLC